MDINILVPILLAVVALIPGIVAIVNQYTKDKNNRNMLLENEIYNQGMIIEGLQRNTEYTNRIISDIPTIDELWERIYEKPVIIRCSHCNSPNVITVFNCTQCGAPMEAK